MKKIRIRYLVEDTDRHGNVRLYFRRPGGRKIRIRADFRSPEFWLAYNAAFEGKEPLEASNPGPRHRQGKRMPSAPETYGWLCEQYYVSAAYRQLHESTRKQRRRMLDALRTDDGDKPYKLLRKQHIILRMGRLADTPASANNLLKALRRLFGWAADMGYADHNPAVGVKRFPLNPDGHHTWTIEEIRQFQKRHPLGTKAYLALALLLYTGVRRSDVVKLGPQNERDGTLLFTEVKGARRAPKHRKIPILPALREAIIKCPSGQLAYLTTVYGVPFKSSNAFGNWLKDRCLEANLTHCSAHGLRKTAATLAAEAGATEFELMSIFGWESPSEAARYTRKARRDKMAGKAMHFIALPPEQDANKSVPLPNVVEIGGTKKGEKP